jgi:hypothetical protein
LTEREPFFAQAGSAAGGLLARPWPSPEDDEDLADREKNIDE